MGDLGIVLRVMVYLSPMLVLFVLGTAVINAGSYLGVGLYLLAIIYGIFLLTRK